MSDEQAAKPASPQFAIQKVYLKDVSLETPNSPQVFTEQWKPEVNLQINNSATRLTESVHEVVLTVTATAKLGERTAYLVEVQQAGVFTLEGFEPDQLAQLLGAYCPNILFPFAREAISSLITQSGFPALLLSPVNFDGIYAQQQAQRAAAAEASGESRH